MPVLRALSHGLLMLALFVAASARADELKNITLLANQGQNAQALERINTYLISKPKDIQAIFLRGVLLAETGKRDEAIKTFTELTEKNPTLPEPYNNLAVLYADQGQYDKARTALDAAIKTHPSYATAHENLGDIYARMASDAYGKALQLDTSNTRAKSKLSLIKDLFASPTPPVQTTAKVEVPKETQIAAISVPPAPAKSEPKAEVKPAKPVPEEVKAPAPVISSNQQAVTDAVQHWAQAWSSQNVDQYLASYASNFKTPNGETRKAWENIRRERLSKPSKIQVSLNRLEVSFENDHSAKVRFQQSYRSGSLSQRTSKLLVMTQQHGKWLIQQELTDR
ncbi:tetratricopeptide repeat protein [Methylobacillus gramineus]|uniref:nuclear transport factor 2 family protein n=1 Tax=Methylobacillus gramineus TaxID=755169 RepID=UPI001CFFB550|nr:tetratricopeptide repeat protein [Methylobacillus gramineus]MCB5185178.1 tetratricopeptide repeat protein [Methylobacillus gramineus]